MSDLERVITHFKDAIEASGNGNKWRFVRVDIIKKAIELLKKQEPRVLALDELRDGGCYWLEVVNDFVICTICPVICIHKEDYAWKRYVHFTWQFGTYSKENDDYGKTWRCWSTNPTDEQREEVKWDE